MGADIEKILDFYASATGQVTQSIINREIIDIWGSCQNHNLLGVGYSPPFLSPFDGKCDSIMHCMPARMGIASSAIEMIGERSVMVHPQALPLPDESFDRILLVHGLEHIQKVNRFLREIWRVLSPEGRLLLIVPNRRGLWARSDVSPFGDGQPYSVTQVCGLLRDNLLEPRETRGALYMLPPRRTPGTISIAVEKWGKRLWPRHCGVHIIEAQKHVYGGDPIDKKKVKVFGASTAPTV